MSRYTTALLDLDNTLLDFDLDERTAVSKTLVSFGAEPTREITDLYSKINAQMWREHEKGIVTKQQLKIIRFTRFLASSGLNIKATPEQMNAVYEQNLRLGGAKMPQAEDFCRTLFEAGIELNIVTNGTKKTQQSRMKSCGLGKYIKEVFISEDMGCNKPFLEFFTIVFDRIVEKDRKKIVLLGDSLTSDIAGANVAGIDSIWLNRNNLAPGDVKPTYTVSTLPEAAIILIAND